MRYEQNWQYYLVPVIFLNVPNLKYDPMSQLMLQVLTLLTQPGLVGGVHVVELASGT